MTDWKFKPEHIEEIGSEDPWYAISMGGYLKPDRCLVDPEQAKKVNDAVSIVESFFQAAYDAGVLEEC